MAQLAPDIPTRFPCWCKAIYSWGGETDRDLGFVEGDLIECLNAGDGSWWMGRLRRDRRMMGLFPSNFVVVLDDSFQPASRAASPMPGLRQNGGSISRANSPSPEKKKPSRKPFSGYKTASPMSTPPSSSRPTSKDILRPFDPSIPPSTALWANGAQSGRNSRSPSPMPNDIGSSPPPPAPPPHRVALSQSGAPRATSPAPLHMNDRYQIFSRTPSPGPASMNGHTPPMLRDAMDDVMSSLEGMSTQQKDGKESDLNPWSPEYFDTLHRPSSTRPPARPLTSLGLGAGGSNYDDQQAYSSNHNSPDRYQDGPPQLSNYVQRMQARLEQMYEQNPSLAGAPDADEPPEPPPKNPSYTPRPQSSLSRMRPSLKGRKSAYELGRNVLQRTFTIKSNATNSSSGAQSNATSSSSKTNRSIMSGHSAGAFSATSAGSLARRNQYGGMIDGRPMTSMAASRMNSYLDPPRSVDLRPQTPLTGISYHSSHDSRQGAQSAVPWAHAPAAIESAGMLGGFAVPKAKKQGFLKKIIDGAKTGAASARSSIAASQSGSLPPSPIKSKMTGIAGGISSSYGQDAAREMGLDNNDWVQVRRDANRSTSISAMERKDRAERCQMLDHPVIYPLEELYGTAEGDEDANGHPIVAPLDFNASQFNLNLVDKAARFISSLPPMTTPTSLAQGYVCRPHRSDVQRLRAIFTWVSEKIAWEEDFEGDVDTRRTIQTKRGSSREVAALVADMCAAIGIHADVVGGYLKTPGESLNLDANLSHPNHYWNTIVVDGQWRIMDCSLASPTNPRRPLYSAFNAQTAEAWYFLTRPMHICFTHIPMSHEHQHIYPPIAPDVLLALPAACPSYFKNDIYLHDYDTSLVRLEGLEIATIHVAVPPDVEVVAEMEVKAFMRDSDGDFYENGDVVKKRALFQPSWHAHPSDRGAAPQKRFIVKGLLPSDEGHGVLKVYAGKKGLMHSSKDNPHPLAFALPIYHQGENPPYDFLVRHPTPHATRHDLYVVQPQCYKLGWNNTFVFTVRQHPSSLSATTSPDPSGGTFDAVRPVSPSPFTRPASAMSMTSSSANGSSYDTPATSLGSSMRMREVKPAKLAIQSPSGKILRLPRKVDSLTPAASSDGTTPEGSVWETVVKVGEKGTWRGLVLADRSARWCVWGEWECV